MISDKMTKELNKQINAELYSAYLYLAMSAYATESDLNGAATWFAAQMKEETEHAQKMYNYLCDQGSRVVLEEIEKPPTEFGTLKEMLETTLEHEQKVTGMIHDLAVLADEEKDYASANFLQWFVDEQVEEENSVRALLAQVNIAGETGPGLLMVDRSMGERGTASEGQEEE